VWTRRSFFRSAGSLARTSEALQFDRPRDSEYRPETAAEPLAELLAMQSRVKKPSGYAGSG